MSPESRSHPTHHKVNAAPRLRRNLSYTNPMERKAAAEFLGVSMSTLDRFASQGRLTRGRARGKTRPLTVFDREELASLKEEFARKAEAMPKVPIAERPQDAVGFRLDPHYVRRLAEAGAKEDMSAGEYARRLVIRGLETEPGEAYAREIRTLRHALSGMFFLILVERFGVSHDEAHVLVTELSEC